METKTTTVAKINNVKITMIENGEKLVPIRPICQALGIDEDSQRRKINDDEILSSTATLSVAVGGDKKEREMFCLPLKYVFGWLFTINPKNVKPEAQESVGRFRIECYNALFEHFILQSQFLEEKQVAIDDKTKEMDVFKSDFKHAKMRLDNARKEFDEIREVTFEKWKADRSQLKFDFDNPINI